MAKATEIGRVLPYESAQYEEKMSSFVLRVREQLEVLRLGIQNGNVNDPKIAKNYAKKVEKFLEVPFILDKANKDKRVKHLKRETKIDVGVRKALIEIVSKVLENIKRQKIATASSYSPYSENPKVDFPMEVNMILTREYWDLDVYGIQYISERITMNKLIGLLTDKEFMKTIGCKNSWQVSTLKKALTEYVQEHSEELELVREISIILSLPLFKEKNVLELDVAKFKEIIQIRPEILKRLIEWVANKEFRISAEKELLYSQRNKLTGNKFISDLFEEYDVQLKQLSEELKQLKEEYSLYRFGQGLIEKDIFDTLYK